MLFQGQRLGPKRHEGRVSRHFSVPRRGLRQDGVWSKSLVMRRIHPFAPRLAGALLLALSLSALSGCSLRTLLPGGEFSSPEATVRAYGLAEDAEQAARCFPDSWPMAERLAMAGKLGEFASQRIVSTRPTRFAGEPLAVYGKASVVVDSADREVLQDIVRADGATERWWYLLRDCAGSWKILALYRNSGQ